MKTKILVIIANIMMFAIPLIASANESDTVWTKNLFPCEIKGSSFSLTGDSIITIAGVSGSDTLFILETTTGNILKKIKIKPFSFSLGCLTHFNTKSWIAVNVSGAYGGMYIFDYIKEKIIKDTFGFMGKAIAITNNDKYLFVQNINNSPKNISILDIEKNEFIDSISSGYGAAHSLAISPDDKYLAIGTGKSKIVNPDPENPDYEEERMFDKILIFNLETKEIIKEFDGNEGTEGMLINMKFSPDGNYLGIAKLDGTIRVYKIDELELYRKFIIEKNEYHDNSGPWYINFSKNSEYIYCGIKLYGQYNTKIWNIKDNLLIKSYDFCSYSGININYNDNVLVACDYDLTYLFPNWLSSVNEFNILSNDTTNIIINKSINSVFQYNYEKKINNINFYNYTGNIINNKGIFIINTNNISINSNNLQYGIYFLSINEDKPIKILVTE